MMDKQKRYKIITLVVSIILTGLVVGLYFLDTSLEWGLLKIGSCILVSIWTFFIPPTVLYYIYKLKNSGVEFSIRVGVGIGLNGLYMLLIAPIFGLLAYFSDLDEVRG